MIIDYYSEVGQGEVVINYPDIYIYIDIDIDIWDYGIIIGLSNGIILYIYIIHPGGMR